MQSRVSNARALVFGGSGFVGGQVLRGLARAGVATAFTWNRSRQVAETLAKELSQQPVQVDLSSSAATRAALRGLRDQGFEPNVFIHCAGVNRLASLEDLSDQDWQLAQAVNCQSAFIAVQELAPEMTRQKQGHIVLVGALDRTQSAPMPIHFAASQGGLSALAMAVAKELGGKGVRINLVSLGLLEAGLSGAIDSKLVDDYKKFSALRRLGQPDEVARAILWLALENTYMNGKVLAVNGGM